MNKYFDYDALPKVMGSIECEYTKNLLISHINHLFTSEMLTDISEFETESDETPDDSLMIYNYLKLKKLIKDIPNKK